MYDYPIEQDVSSAYYNLIFFFIILLILAFFVYVSFVVSTKQPDRVNISKADFDLFENQSNQPDLLLTGEENQGKKLDYSKIYDFASIKFCPAGQCVVNKNNGTKRCPENPTDALTYSAVTEACTRPNYCDNIEVPYALRSDGSALDFYCGDDLLKCRCVANPQCPYYVTSSFDMLNGSVYGVNNNQLNYFFSINTEDNAFFNKNPIVFKPDDIGTRFCKLNPAFTDRIPAGCNFSDSINDPIDCQNSDLFQILEDNNDFATLVVNNFSQFGGLAFNCSTDGIDYNTGDTSINIYSTGPVPTKGLYKIILGSTTYYIIYNSYTKTQFVQNLELGPYNSLCIDGGNELVYTVYTLKGITGQEEGKNWRTGLPFNFKFPHQKTGGRAVLVVEPDEYHPKLTPEFIRYQPCTDNRPAANFKNMLRCVQPEEQPCINGTLAYNIDKIIDTSTTESIFQQNNSRNFCNAYNKDRFDATKADSFYLNDPGSFTTSCVIGNGCGGTFDVNLCTEDNCTDAIRQRKNNFFENYDQSAVSNRWIVTANEPDNFASIKIIKGTPPRIELTNAAMFDLETGDYWSRYNPPIIKYLSSDALNGATVLSLNNTQGVSINNEVLYPGYPATLPKITNINGNNITLNSSITIGLCQNTGIEIINTVGANDFGVIGTYGGANYLLSIDATSSAQLDDEQIRNMEKDGVVIYKQFGFNGINYNTTYDRSGNEPLRYYSPSFVNSFFLKKNAKSQPVYEFLSGTDGNLTNAQYSAQAFNYSDAGFKNKKSMYYPVWNNSNFRQECIMCRPSFFAYAGVTSDNKLQSAQIQFSGQQFFNYVHNIQNDTFAYSTFTKIVSTDDNPSNTNYLIMEDINTNIAIGDYVLDSTGLMDRIYQTTSNTNGSKSLSFITPLAPIIKGLRINSIMPNSFYQPFTIIDKKGKKHSLAPTQGIKPNIISPTQLATDGINKAPNYFMGLKYQANNLQLYEIVPVAKIIDIIDPTGTGIKNVLITDNGFNIEMPTNKEIFIQTIRLTDTLDLSVVQDIDNPDKATGSGATVKVGEISSGRISDITITNVGNNYSVENRPNILLNNFYSGEEINILTQ
jgi:hypothetical protein